MHAFVNDLERPVGTSLYGRRRYEVMLAWETISLADQPPAIRDVAEMVDLADERRFGNGIVHLPYHAGT